MVLAPLYVCRNVDIQFVLILFPVLENLMMPLARLVEWEMACSKVIVREFNLI